MRTRQVHTEEGAAYGFEIGYGFFFDRGAVARLLRRTPGVEVTKFPKRFAVSDDDFVHFNYRGNKYLVIEPFGDNDRFLVRAEEPSGYAYVEELREVFARHRILGFL